MERYTDRRTDEFADIGMGWKDRYRDRQTDIRIRWKEIRADVQTYESDGYI